MFQESKKRAGTVRLGQPRHHCRAIIPVVFPISAEKRWWKIAVIELRFMGQWPVYHGRL